ncbi:hypothetical protein AAFF_G00391290 [Aldrovandia affinis]|uniref:Reverse transcriptase domain-containing protein n=1 Tax=Aldrovandia affinis TaxID=143900 RepID=A0AAD7SDV3_9TELE|nr:hypothetical protein AAFF_G00391290 [Aldrovandia affinis]
MTSAHTERRVLVNNTYSDLLHTSTGSPQGCVLSPLLFIPYTDDCRTSHPNCHLVKFADDTVLLSLLSDPAQDHGPALEEFMEWCDASCLELNVTKTKEMVVVFSSRQQESRVSRQKGGVADCRVALPSVTPVSCQRDEHGVGTLPGVSALPR